MGESVEALGRGLTFSQYVTLNDFGFNGGAHVTGPGSSRRIRRTSM